MQVSERNTFPRFKNTEKNTFKDSDQGAGNLFT